MIARIIAFTMLVLAMFLFGVSVHAADYYYGPPPARIVPAPPVVVQPPAVLVPVQPRCHTVRETTHDDILGTNDYTEQEVCDED